LIHRAEKQTDRQTPVKTYLATTFGVNMRLRKWWDLIESGLGSVLGGGHFLFFCVDEAAEDSEQLKIAGRSDVVVTTQLVKESRGTDRH